MTLPNDLLSELNAIGKTRSYRVFREEALRILKEHGFKHHSNGGFTDVYRKKGFRYVIKLARAFDAKFHRIEEYQEGYLDEKRRRLPSQINQIRSSTIFVRQ